MHRFQSESVIRRFRFAAFLFCLKLLLFPFSSGVLIFSLWNNDRELTIISVWMFALTMLVVILQWLIAVRTRCPLCLTPVLATKQCAKHKNARTLFGSYRLRAALAILFRDWFHCPYCNEPCAMEVRNPRNQTRGRHR
jgi:cytochrome bd-type quinol oxidase subunit 1